MDNWVAESAFYKDTSSNKMLFDTMLRLREYAMFSNFKLHVLHISGKRMIAIGVDRISRGSLTEGIFAGKQFLQLIQFHKGVLDLDPNSLILWIKLWAPSRLELLTPEGWFTRGQGTKGGKKNPRRIWMLIEGEGVFSCSPPCSSIIGCCQRTI